MIPESVPVHGFGLGPNKAQAKRVAIQMAHGFANAGRRRPCVRVPMSEREMP